MAIVVWGLILLFVLLIGAQLWEADDRAPKGPPLDRDLHWWESLALYGGLAFAAVCLLFMAKNWLQQRRDERGDGADGDSPSH